MAHMIPALFHPTVRSATERRLFEFIRDAPGTDDWVCLHSLASARHDRKRRGEIDYLLLTRKGVFVLEVKGGRIAREGGVWVFTNRRGEQERKYESPFERASGAMFSLERDLRNKFGKDHRIGRLLFGCGVLFPDVVFDDYGTEGDRAIVYDARDRSAPFTAFVDRIAAFSRQRDPVPRYAPTEKDMRDLVDYLRGDFDLVPPLGVRLDDVTSRLVQLTNEQYLVLDACDSPAFPLLVIQGGARVREDDTGCRVCRPGGPAGARADLVSVLQPAVGGLPEPRHPAAVGSGEDGGLAGLRLLQPAHSAVVVRGRFPEPAGGAAGRVRVRDTPSRVRRTRRLGGRVGAVRHASCGRRAGLPPPFRPGLAEGRHGGRTLEGVL